MGGLQHSEELLLSPRQKREGGGDKKLLQLTGRETEVERVNQACEKSCFDGGRCCKFGYSE